MILGTFSSDPSGRTTSVTYLNYFGGKRALRSVALSIHFAQIPSVYLKGLSHEIDFKNVDQKLKNLA
jgi:hypothetical protein